MSAVKLYLPLAMLLSSVLGQSPSKWSPYMLQIGSQQYMVQGAPMQDLQGQATEYRNFNFGPQNGGQSYEQEFTSQGEGFPNDGQQIDSKDFGQNNLKHDFNNFKPHSYNVHQHVEEENPEPIKHYKEVVVPLPKNVEFKINQPIIIPVPHPVPIHVPVPKAVVIPIVKEVAIQVEKSVPYPVEKTVHVPKIKEVPFEVVKHIIVPVEKPFPFKVPVYETVIHSKKGSYKI
ncbi:unnamed protein product [Plutella xylostella]|uniref:(diamondback moth) hypothetical protein n=1 Tax=Plutella xylostella TaxID=51655 RepID=A0A8S4FXU1_PLUXY|nr:unnamed protein product [Plutella xylostella]